jgi:hypothetical protein
VYFHGEMPELSSKKFFLYLLVASVGVSALVGISVVLFGDFGEFETRVLLTTLTVTVTSVLGLACGAYLETGRGRLMPLAGIGFAALSAGLWIFLLWHGTVHSDLFVKTLFSATLLAAACSHLSLLSLARLDRKFLWAQRAAHLLIWSLTLLVLYLIWQFFENVSDFLTRLTGVLSILVAALTVLMPVLHRLSGQKTEGEEIDAEIARLRLRLEELEKRKANLPVNETAEEAGG